MQIKVKKLHPRARLPQYAGAGDVGMDLYCLEGFSVVPGSREVVTTGIAIEFEQGYAALVWDKGGIAVKRGLKVLGGVFDAGYRGDYTVCLFNTSNETQHFDAGDKIAQLIIQKVEIADIEETDELSDSDRGDGRFGSTGKN
jgi:dUTP pyrophosphatase